MDDFQLDSKTIGALPLVNRIIKKLELNSLLEKHVPCKDLRFKLAPATCIGVLMRNILLAREPLYGLSEWAVRYDEQLLGLTKDTISLINDDRVGRSLDALFAANRAGLLTEVIVNAFKVFNVDLNELHNDSTTVSFTGQYLNAKGQAVNAKATKRITYGHNKDHRPDLKQLLFILTTSGDGAIPVWHKVEHGNTSDDRTHIETWEALRQVVGKPDFLYVADSKLCTKENMAHIANKQGRFLSILPKTRREDSWFRDWLQKNEPKWEELLRKRGARKTEPEEIYRGFESPQRSVEGYRIIWIWSSQKHELDRSIRQSQIEQAIRKLEQLRDRLNSSRSRLKTLTKVESAVDKILLETRAARWIEVKITQFEEEKFVQATPGRPSENTAYLREAKEKYKLHWQSNVQALQYDSQTDGIFPLILNDESLSLLDALLAYKRQPHLEKRHEQLKTVFEVMPVNLKSVSRIEAFLFVYFLVLLVASLIEREVRKNMKNEGRESLPMYPEGRPCKTPTSERIFEIFQDIRRHKLSSDDGSINKCFYDSLNDLQIDLLRLLALSSDEYFEKT